MCAGGWLAFITLRSAVQARPRYQPSLFFRISPKTSFAEEGIDVRVSDFAERGGMCLSSLARLRQHSLDLGVVCAVSDAGRYAAQSNLHLTASKT